MAHVSLRIVPSGNAGNLLTTVSVAWGSIFEVRYCFECTVTGCSYIHGVSRIR
jgi:hypothetical protein